MASTLARQIRSPHAKRGSMSLLSFRASYLKRSLMKPRTLSSRRTKIVSLPRSSSRPFVDADFPNERGEHIFDSGILRQAPTALVSEVVGLVDSFDPRNPVESLRAYDSLKRNKKALNELMQDENIIKTRDNLFASSFVLAQTVDERNEDETRIRLRTRDWIHMKEMFKVHLANGHNAANAAKFAMNQIRKRGFTNRFGIHEVNSLFSSDPTAAKQQIMYQNTMVGSG